MDYGTILLSAFMGIYFINEKSKRKKANKYQF